VSSSVSRRDALIFSSLLQLPSCGEGIQTRKNWLNTNWQVIDATAAKKLLAQRRVLAVLSAKYFDLEGVALDCSWIFGLDRLRAQRQYHPSPEHTFTSFH
jgi:hypothetical protein